MRWEIDSAATGGLKAIGSIPSISPCLIEGRNGIGKTVAIQLMQLASGDMPAELSIRPDLWESLRTRIGSTKITGYGLRGADSLEVRFTPETWPTSPAVEDWDVIASAKIDGERASMAQVSALLHVTRIAGNEDLSDSIDRHRTLLETQLRSVGSKIRAREREVRATAGDIISALQRVDPLALDEVAAALESATEAEAVAAQASQAAASNLNKAVRLEELKRSQGVTDQAAETLLSERDAAARRIAELAESLDEAQADADRLAEVLRKEGGVSERLAEASDLLRKRKAREATLDRSAAEAAERLEVDAGASSVETAIQEADRALDRLAAAQHQLDATGQVRGLLDSLIPALDSAPSALDGQLLADGFEPPLEIAAARRSMTARHEALAAERTPAQVRALLEEIQSLSERRAELLGLADTINKLARAAELRESAQSDYDALEKQAKSASKNAEASRAADEVVGAIQHELTLTHEVLAATSKRLAVQGTMSHQDAAREIATLERDLAAGPDPQSMDVEERRVILAASDAALDECRRRLVGLNRRSTSLQTDLAELAARLMTEPWLQEITATRPLFLASGEPDVERYRLVRSALLSSIQSIRDAGELIARLEGMSREFFRARNSGPTTLDEHGQELSGPFAAMLSARLLEGLNSPSIRERLFDGGEATALDPVTRSLTIRHADGSHETRPMSSYSTGEQAFAFTQARILDIQPSEEPNRLLVLDEFGAFVSADRIPDLADFLASDRVASIADQVLVILPLQVNYEAEIENTTGHLRETYESRLTQIRAQGYCAVELL